MTKLSKDQEDMLAKVLDGELDVSSLAQRLYSQDASIYQEKPLGVVRPRHREDCQHLITYALEQSIPLIPRAGGTSLAGQCVGSGLVVDISRHMTRIIDLQPKQRTARVQPGVIQDDLNDRAAVAGLKFAPDTSTSKQAMIGGMIGNNSCGAYSIVHGSTRDHVLELEAVLSDGSMAQFGPLSTEQLAAKKQLNNLEGAIYRTVCEIIDQHRDLILGRFPKPQIKRRNMGYALDILARQQPWDPDGPPFNMIPMLCGSEGSLCLITEALLKLVPIPKHKKMVCAHFRNIDEACRGTLVALPFQPTAIELIDGIILHATRNNREQNANRFWIQGEKDPGAVLLIEFHASAEPRIDENIQQLIEAMGRQQLGYAFPVVQAQDMTRVLALRKAGLGLLTGIPGDEKSVTAIEDTAVAVEDLPAYIRDIGEVMRRNGCACVHYGHASVGLLHLRPMLNLKTEKDLGIFKNILEQTAEVLVRYGGSLSGEHGDGRLRSPYIQQMLTPDVYDLLVKIKQTFDPKNIFNPNKIIDAKPVTDSLRAHPQSRTPDIETVFDWSREKGLVRATELCNGAGFCRQSPGRGVMCPSYMATLEEAYTTRGRANVMRQLLTSENPEQTWSHPDLTAVLDTCLSCKGCMTECPSSVNMARLKAEFLQKQMDEKGVKLRSHLFGYFGFYARLARLAPTMASWAMNLSISKRILGIAVQRTIPAFAARTLSQWFKQHTASARAGQSGEVVLFNDEFTNYTEPGVGIAAIEVLESAGYKVNLVDGLDSARTYLSKGFLRKAKALMTQAVRSLRPYVERNLPIIGLEPSALLGFRDEAPDLAPADLREKAVEIGKQCLLFDEFMLRQTKNGGLRRLKWQKLSQSRILVHGHCHQKALASTNTVLESLRLIPEMDVGEIPSGCCGMAGSFGYEKEHYELSMKIGELVLFPAIRAEPEALICAPGTSCRQQIMAGCQRRAYHPAEVLRMAIKSTS